MQLTVSRTNVLFALATAGLLVATTGCGESIDSGSVSTDGVYADFYARADGSGQTKVHAGLKTGGPNSNTFLNLEAGDELTFHQGSEAYEPETQSVFNQFNVYEKPIPADDGGDDFRIEFTRASGANAPNSTTVLPKKFSIDSPGASDSFSRENDDVEITLSAADNTAQQSISVSGSCIANVFQKEFSGTSVTIPKGSLKEVESDDIDETCNVSLTVRFTKAGEVDPAYQGGRFDGIQRRTASFESKP